MTPIVRRASTLQRNFKIAAMVLVPFRMLFAKVSVTMADTPLRPGPVIYVANHRSFFDIPVGLELFMRHGLAPQVAVHRRFFDRRPLGWLLRACGCVPLGPGLGDQWIAAAGAELDAGRPVAMMPQGRITSTADHRDGIGKLRTGVARLAQTSGAPTVPIGAVGTNEVWPLGRPLPRRGLRRRTVEVRVGSALPPPARDAVDLTAFVDEISAALRRLVEA